MTEPGPPSDARRNAADAVTWPVRVAAAWTWRLLLLGLGMYVFARLFQRVELVSFSFVIALFLTSILHPLEKVLRRIPGPRSISALLALLIGLGVLAGIGYFVSWQISNHASELGDQISQTVDNARDWLQNGPLHLKSSDLDKIADNITTAIQRNQGQLLSGAIQTVQTIVESLGALLLVLLSTFFLLRDGDVIWRWTLGLFPRGTRDRVDHAGRTGWHTLGGYMRGQVMIALFHGISVMIILFVLQVPLAAALGVLIFLGAFIPIIGLVVVGALCTAVAGLEHGVTAAIVVAVAITVLVQLESHLLQPLIMSRSVEVHPLAIAISVLTGTVLAGIIGALLAVPLVAFVNSVVHALRRGPGGTAAEGGPPPPEPFPVARDDTVDGEQERTRDDDAADSTPEEAADAE